MPDSKSIGTQVSAINLALKGAKSYAGKLPKEVAVVAKSLQARKDNIEALDADQEKAKQALVKVTAALKGELKAANLERASIVRFAEATFGRNAAEIKEFRPETQGKVIKAKVK